jgi:hypothetical protein
MLVKFLIILLLLAVGAAIVYFFARSHTIECIRDRSGRVGATITHSGIKYYKKERIPAGELLRAELESESSQDSEGKSSTSYRVRLITLKYTTFLTSSGSSNYADAIRKIEQINYFIQDSTQKAIVVTQDNRVGGYIFGGVFGIMGPLIVLLSPSHG